MPRDPYPEPPGTSPDGQPQPDAIYCPLCMAHLRAIPSRRGERPPGISHRYECEHGHVWEINGIPNARDWNGARPGWDRETGPEA